MTKVVKLHPRRKKIINQEKPETHCFGNDDFIDITILSCFNPERAIKKNLRYLELALKFSEGLDKNDPSSLAIKRDIKLGYKFLDLLDKRNAQEK